MLTKVKVQGKTVSEAISKGLRELNMRRDQVEITVLEHPKKGFLGIGSKPAIIEVRKKRWASDNLDSEIYMDVPRRRNNRGRSKGRNHMRSRRGNSRRSAPVAAKSEERTPRVRTPKANEPQLLPKESIQNAVIPETLKAPMQEVEKYVTDVLTHMGVKVENLHAWWDEKQQRILVTFDCDKPAIVIGKEGKTLEAIQYLSTLALTRHFNAPLTVVTDTQNYWRKAEDKIDADIAKAVDMLTHGVSVFRFRPMSSQLRRYIHRSLEGNEWVQTASEGEGKWRKVTLRPSQKALDAYQANMAPADFVPGVIGEDAPQETAPVAETVTTQTAAAETTTATAPAQETAAQTTTQETAPVAETTQETAPVAETTQETAPVAETQTATETQTTPAQETATAQTATAAETATTPAQETATAEKPAEETPTQKVVSQTVAATVAESVVQTPSHTVVERSVIITTRPATEDFTSNK